MSLVRFVRKLPLGLLAMAGIGLVGCGVSDDPPPATVNHDLSGKDFIRINDIFITGGTNSDSTTSGAASIQGVEDEVVVADSKVMEPQSYSLRVPIVDDSGAALEHLEGTDNYSIDMQVRPGVVGSPTAYIPFDFSLTVASETVTQ